MGARQWPLLGTVLDAGTDDPVLQGLLIAGPAVIALVVLIGRSPLTTAIAAAYLAVLVGNTLRNGLLWLDHEDGN